MFGSFCRLALALSHICVCLTYSAPFPLSPFQKRSVKALEEGLFPKKPSSSSSAGGPRDAQGLEAFTQIVTSPTGSGKTVVAYYFCSMIISGVNAYPSLSNGGVVVYATPLKSLSRQKFKELSGIFNEDRVAVMTGDGSYNVNADTEIVVCTTEVLRNAMYSTASLAGKDIAGVVLDEFHYLGVKGRGGAVEEVLALAEPSVRILCLTATMINAGEVKEWLTDIRGGRVELVKADKRDVSLIWEWWDGRGGKQVFRNREGGPGGRMEGVNNGGGDQIHPALVKEANKRKRGKRAFRPNLGRVLDYLVEEDMYPAIFFVFSRKRCETEVEFLVRWLGGTGRVTLDGEVVLRGEGRRTDARSTLLEPSEKMEVIDAVNEYNARVVPEMRLEGSRLSSLMVGVHFHHAGLMGAHRYLIEDLFSRKLIKVLVATTTLAAGINMPCRTAVITALTKRGDAGFEDVSRGEVRQMAGRAGRRGIDDLGYCLVLQGGQFDGAEKIRTAVTGSLEDIKSVFKVHYGLVLCTVATGGGMMGVMRKVVEKNFGSWTKRRARERARSKTTTDEQLDEFESFDKEAVKSREKKQVLVDTLRKVLSDPCSPSLPSTKYILSSGSGKISREIRKYEQLVSNVATEQIVLSGQEKGSGDTNERLRRAEEDLGKSFFEIVASGELD